MEMNWIPFFDVILIVCLLLCLVRSWQRGFLLQLVDLGLQGEQILAALKIMQEIGIDYMMRHGMEEPLRERGLL